MVKDLKKVVLYHADWCGYCKTLMPEWKKFEEAAKDSGFQVEAVNERSLNPIDKLRISGYPTINLVDNDGGIYEYAGSRNGDSLINHAKNFKQFYVEGKLPQNGGCGCVLNGGAPCSCAADGTVAKVNGDDATIVTPSNTIPSKTKKPFSSNFPNEYGSSSSNQKGGVRRVTTNQSGGVSMIDNNEDREQFYKMKYYKYKAKIAKLLESKQK